MGKQKTKKEKPIGACDFCWGYHEDLIREPIPDNPNIIFVTDQPINFKTQADRLLSSIAKKFNASPIWISAKQCALGSLSLDEIKRVRELVLIPVLSSYPNLPLVVFGEYAARLVAGKNPTDTSMVNKALEFYGHVCAFTYPIDFYLNPEKGNRSNYILSNIETTIKAALIQPVETAKVIGKLPFGKSLEKIVIDVETTDHDYPFTGHSELVCVGIMPLGKPTYHIKASEITDKIRDELAKNTKLVIGHNIMFDLVHLSYVGINFPQARIHDTMIYHKNLFPSEPFYGLKPLTKKYHNFGHWDAWFATKHRNKKAITDEDYGKLCLYNSYDLYATESLFMDQGRQYTPFALEMDYLRYALQMTLNGFCVDTTRLDAQIKDLTIQVENCDSKFREDFSLGKDFNLNSPTQVLAFLRRNIPKLADTNAGTLQKYENDYPFIQRLLELRGLVKLKGTSLEGLKEYIDVHSLVHSSYSIHGAETGRSSSSSPNLQNTDPRVRSLFVSRYPQGRLVYTDLSGIEYRLIGHTSKDKNLLNVFNTGKDIHDEMYMALFHEPPPNKERRKKAKTANFCGVYGGGYKKFILSAELPDNEESRELYKIASNRYPGVAEWKKEVIRGLYRSRSVRNLFGRIRCFNHIDMDVEREAINWIIQSSGHDVLKIYSMEMCDLLKEHGLLDTLLVSEVHDSNTFDSPPEEVDEAFQLIVKIGENLNPLIEEMYGVKMRVPIMAETEIMTQWA